MQTKPSGHVPWQVQTPPDPTFARIPLLLQRANDRLTPGDKRRRVYLGSPRLLDAELGKRKKIEPFERRPFVSLTSTCPNPKKMLSYVELFDSFAETSLGCRNERRVRRRRQCIDPSSEIQNHNAQLRNLRLMCEPEYENY